MSLGQLNPLIISSNAEKLRVKYLGNGTKYVFHDEKTI